MVHVRSQTLNQTLQRFGSALRSEAQAPATWTIVQTDCHDEGLAENRTIDICELPNFPEMEESPSFPTDIADMSIPPT